LLTERSSTKQSDIGNIVAPNVLINNSFGAYSNSYVQGPSNGNNNQDAAYRGKQFHFDGWNYLFVDGHVKWLKPQATLGGAANAGTKAPGNLWLVFKS
jgi:prepilin-type processing-associated H-X9-DG protein